MKKKVIAMLLAVALILSCMPQVAVALESNSVSYRYCDESGQNWQIGTTNSYSPVLSDTTELTTGWYVVTGTVACQNTLSVSGEVNLILTDDSSLTAAQGIQLNGSAKLSIYAQEKQNGVLVSQGVGRNAGLGVCESAELVIYGGAITATGSAEGVGAGAGIGGNYSTAAGTIIIHAGEINATGASEAYGGAAGIGGGGQSSDAKKVVITGGNITAIGGQNGAAGIGGGGHDGELRSFAISGGWINATGFKALDGRGEAHAIGGGMSKAAADLSGATNAMVLDGSTKIATYYGASLARDMVIPEGYTMYIAKGQSLTIPDGVSLTNNGAIVVCGTLNNAGTLSGSGAVTQHRFTNAVTCDLCGEYQIPELNSSNQYEIYTASHLFWFAGLVNGTLTDGTSQNKGADAKLMADIDLAGYDWFPIGIYCKGDAHPSGSDDSQYVGTFDGNYHTISNITVNQTLPYECGLFGRIYGTGTIRNLGVINANLTCTGTKNDGANGIRMGVIAGECHLGTIENCFSAGTIVLNNGNGQKGGISGEVAGGTIINCYTTYETLTNAVDSMVSNSYDASSVKSYDYTTGRLAWLLNGRANGEDKIYKQSAEYPAFVGETVNFTGEITEVVVTIDSPKGEQPFPTNAASTTPGVSVVSVKWTKDDESSEALSGNAAYHPWVYKAYIVLQADADYFFPDSVVAHCEGFYNSQVNDDGTLTIVIRRGSNQTPLEAITAPDAVVNVPNGVDDLAAYLPSTVTVKTGSENVNSAGVTWDVVGSNYDKTLTTEQTFTVTGTVNLPEEVSNPNHVPLTVEITVTVSASELIDYDVVDTSPGGTTHIQVVGDHHNLSVDVQKDGNSTDKDVQYQWYKMTDVSITNENASTVTDHGYYYSSYNAATGMWTAQRYNEGEAEITSMYFKTNFSAGDILTVKISTDIDGTLCLVGPQNLSAQYDSATCTYVFNVSVDGEYTLQLEDDYSFSNPQVIANVYECAAIAGATEKDYTIPASDAKTVGTNKYIIKATSGNWSEELEIVVNVAGPSYTVTIPATATVNEVLTISADVELLRDKDVLNVYVSATSGTNNAFTLTNAEGVKLGYELKNGDTIIGVNDKILSVASGEEESVDLSIVPDEAKYSGNYTGTITFTIAIKSVQELNFADGKIHIYPTGYKQGNASEITPFVGEYIITGSINGDTPLKIVNDTDAPASYSITLDNAAIVGSAWCTAFLVNSPDAPVVVNLKSTGNCEIRTSDNHQPIKAETPDVTINYELIDGSLYLRGPYSGDGQGVYNEHITFNSSCGSVNAADQSVRLEHTIENGTCTICGATVTE